jgi:hypothetical protein
MIRRDEFDAVASSVELCTQITTLSRGTLKEVAAWQGSC